MYCKPLLTARTALCFTLQQYRCIDRCVSLRLVWRLKIAYDTYYGVLKGTPCSTNTLCFSLWCTCLSLHVVKSARMTLVLSSAYNCLLLVKVAYMAAYSRQEGGRVGRMLWKKCRFKNQHAWTLIKKPQAVYSSIKPILYYGTSQPFHRKKKQKVLPNPLLAILRVFFDQSLIGFLSHAYINLSSHRNQTAEFVGTTDLVTWRGIFKAVPAGIFALSLAATTSTIVSGLDQKHSVGWERGLTANICVGNISVGWLMHSGIIGNISVGWLIHSGIIGNICVG